MDVEHDTETAAGQRTLLAQAAAGDAAAAARLARAFGRRAFVQAHRMLGNVADAEDVAQEALVRLWKIAPRWQDQEARPSTWLYRVVANLCIDRMRRGRRMSPEDEVDHVPADPVAGVERRLQDQARRRALYAALDTLPDRQRQAVVLRHIEGLANPEIADFLEVSVEAAESLVARGKRALAAELLERKADLGFEDD